MTHYHTHRFCSPFPPFLSDVRRCHENYLRHFTEMQLSPFPLPSPACQELHFKMAGRCHAAVWWFVGVYSVSPRLAVSRCTIHFPPVRLIRHSSEEATGHRAFILTEAELRNEPEKLLERCSFNPSQAKQSHTHSQFTVCTIHSMDCILIYKTSTRSLIKDAPCVHAQTWFQVKALQISTHRPCIID